MYVGKTLFAQIMDFVPWTSFRRIVERYGGDVRVRKLNCAEQFRVMAFAQMTWRESLRDIEACLSAQAAKLYHMGLRAAVARSTLPDANELRDWRIWAEFAQVLIHKARRLYATEPLGVDLTNTVYALDSTTIDLCLTVFPWAHFRATRRRRSSCTRCWTCVGQSRASSMSAMASCTTSTSWISCRPNRAPST